MNKLLTRIRPALLAVMLACSPLALAKPPADQLVVGMNMYSLFSLDPANAPGLDASGINANLYDLLIRRKNGDPEQHSPSLAESWTISDDGRLITFALRSDARFHSGNPVTAEDVAWSLQRVLKLNYGLATTWKAYGYDNDNIQRLIRAKDTRTLEVELPQAVDPLLMLDTLATSPSAFVLDRKVVLEHEKDGDLGAAWLVTNAAGSGPFRLANWRANDALVLSRFDEYWGGAAAMKRIVMRHITESQSVRLMLERGDMDMGYGLGAADIAALANKPGMQVQEIPRGTMYYVALSMKQPMFADARVREAVRNLIDYQGLDSVVMPYYGKLNQRPIQLGLQARLENPGYHLDVQRAKALLAEAGYPNGFETTIRTLAEAPFVNIASNLQATLAQAGIKASIVTGTGNQVYGAMRARNFEIIVARGAERYPHPYFALRTFAYNPNNSDEAGLPNFQGWRAGFYSQELNGLIDHIAAERDSQARQVLYRAAQERYEAEKGPIMIVSQMFDSVVSADDVHGFEGDDAEATRYYGVYKKR